MSPDPAVSDPVSLNLLLVILALNPHSLRWCSVETLTPAIVFVDTLTSVSIGV